MALPSAPSLTPALIHSGYVQPAALEIVRPRDFSSNSAHELGQRVLALDQDPGTHGAFLVRAGHLLVEGYTPSDMADFYARTLQPLADRIGGSVQQKEPMRVDTPAASPWPHLDYSLRDTDLNTVFANVTREGSTRAYTAIERAGHEARIGVPLLGMQVAIAASGAEGLPIEYLTEVEPTSLAYSVLFPGDGIFIRNGGKKDGNKARGTAHAFDIGPHANTRTTQRIDVEPSR